MIVEGRWSLPDLEGAIQWCRKRKGEGIRCTLAVMAEYARTPEESAQALEVHLEGIRRAGEQQAGISFSVKPSAIGMLVDYGVYTGNLSLLFSEAQERGVVFEIDMEGLPLVGDTLRSAIGLAGGRGTVTLALQAYLDRTSRDLAACVDAGITVRLVKGAYRGDTGDFTAIQERFRTLAGTLIASGSPFSAATHDPELVGWLREEMQDQKERIGFGFLKGLAERTKTEMAADGWKVSEYVPYGPGGQAYVGRRERYLAMLNDLGRSPVP